MRRLDQLLSSLGYCSRREARGWIDDGRVTVGGAEADDASQKCLSDAVLVDGEPLDHPQGLLLALHKPVGLVCSHDLGEGPRVYDLLPPRWQRRNPPVTTIGRLDRDTSGLLLLTDQSKLVHELTSPKRKVPKIYRAILDRDVAAAEAGRIAGLFLEGTLVLDGESSPCRPAQMRWPSAREAEITIIEGRYHQVRRMFASQGLSVIALHREAFGKLELGGLAAGHWRELPVDHAFF